MSAYDCHACKTRHTTENMVSYCASCFSDSERQRREAEAGAAAMQEVFDLQHKRMVRAISLWQAFPSKPDVPDLGELLEWLIERYNTLAFSSLGQSARIELLERVAEAATDVLRAWDRNISGEEAHRLHEPLRVALAALGAGGEKV